MSTALKNPNPNPEVPIPEAAASSGPGFLDLKPPRDCKIAKKEGPPMAIDSSGSVRG